MIHLTKIQDLDRDNLSQIVYQALSFEQNTSSCFPTLRDYSLATIFQEDSTRTRCSFQMAALNFQMKYLDLNVKTSSIQNKGESMESTLHTLHALGVNIACIRTSDESLFSSLALADLPSNFHLINAGDGSSEHPSQAIGDIVTLEYLNDKTKNITLIGDLKHSRVYNSLVQAILLYSDDIKITLAGPSWGISEREHNYAKSFPHRIRVVECRKEEEMDEVLSESEIIYLLRVQRERHINDNDNNYSSCSYNKIYGINEDRFKKHNFLDKKTTILHPLPANIGTELDDFTQRSPNYKAYVQVRMGLFGRMSIINNLLNHQK